MKRNVDFGKDAAKPSGAPEAGGATNAHSTFGGETMVARGWRFLARLARDLEATAYRRLRDLEAQRTTHGPGSPKRVKEAFSAH